MPEAPSKTGRNDPCWCGSRKKYKKCHTDQDRAKASKTCAPERRDVVQCPVPTGRAARIRPLPADIKCPEYAIAGGAEHICKGYSPLRGPGLEQMRETCHAAQRVLDRATSAVRPGVTTGHLDAIVHEACIQEGG